MRKPHLPDTLYAETGGEETCREISRRFHEKVAKDPLLGPLFPRRLDRLGEHFASFLVERLGGPANYSRTRGKQSLLCRHAHLSISNQEADQWLAHMVATLKELAIPEAAQENLCRYFRDTALTLADSLIPFYKLDLDELREQIVLNPMLLEPTPAGQTLLCHAVQSEDVLRVRLLLASGANPNFQNHGLFIAPPTPRRSIAKNRSAKSSRSLSRTEPT